MKQMTAAQPIKWPKNKKAAAAFTFDVDAESGVLCYNAKFSQRVSMMSHQAYGPLVGVPRILAALNSNGIKGSFFVPGYVALRYPDQIRQIADEGHEIGHHGHLHEPLIGVTQDQELGFLKRGLDALHKVLDLVPKGYRAPMWEINWWTPKLLAEHGFLYDSSLMDSDVPYELSAGSQKRSIVEMPINWALDDWLKYAFVPDFWGTGVIEPPATAIEQFRAEFDAQRANGGLWILTCHPFLSGRPGRAAALAELMRHVSSFDDVWVAPLVEIAEYVRSQKLTPRILSEPDATL